MLDLLKVNDRGLCLEFSKKSHKEAAVPNSCSLAEQVPKKQENLKIEEMEDDL